MHTRISFYPFHNTVTGVSAFRWPRARSVTIDATSSKSRVNCSISACRGEDAPACTCVWQPESLHLRMPHAGGAYGMPARHAHNIADKSARRHTCMDLLLYLIVPQFVGNEL